MKKNVIRLLFALVALLTSTSMLAENKLWIDNFSVTNAEEGTIVAVQMENDPSAAALQFNLVLPEELELLPTQVEGKLQYVYRNSERLNNTQQFMATKQSDYNYKVAVFSMAKETFIGTEGPVAYFRVRSKSNLDETKPVKVELTDIIMSTAAGKRLECDSEYTSEATINAEIKVYSNSTSFVANAGAQVVFPVELKNSVLVQGLQMDIQLPEGFTMENTFEHSDRVSNGAYITPTYNAADNTYRLVMADLSGEDAIRNVGSGRIFDCKINVPADFESGQNIVIKNVIASNGGNAYPGDGASISVVNGNSALATATAAIEALQSKFDEALAVIAETCPDVKDDFTGEEIQTSIDDLKAAVEAAFNDLTLTPDYDKIMAPAAGIEAAIEKLVADAKAAQETEAKRVADNKAAYEATVAKLDALQKNLDDAVEVVNSEYPDFKDQAAIDAAQKMIDDARAAAEAAFEAVKEENNYDYVLNEAGINTAIDGIVFAAQAAKDKAEADKEAARQEANKAAFDKDMESLDALYAHYREVVAEIQADYKEYEDVSAELAVRNALDDAKAAVEKAYKAVEKEGEYGYKLDKEGLTASIDKLLDDAKAKKAAADAEAARVAANKAAYDATKAAIAELQAELDAAKATIEKDYAGFGDAKATADVQAQIDAISKAAADALAAVEKEGNYEFTFDAAPVKDAIAKLIADAKAKKDAADAETVRQNENKAAYDAAKDALAKLQEELDAAIALIKAEYAEYENEEAEAAVQNELNELGTAADEAYAAVEKEGKYDFTVDYDAVKASIDKLVADAKALKDAADAEAARQAENKAAYDAVKDEIAALQAKLDATVETIKAEYPAYLDVEAVAAVQAQIDELGKKADEAYAAVEKEGKFDFAVDAAPVEAAIDALLADAMAKEEARVAANNAAYEAVIAEIAAVQAEYDEAVVTIAENYPDYNATAEMVAITKAISEAEIAADEALKAVEKEGEFSYVFDAQAIRDMIATMLDNADKLGAVDSIEAEVEAGNAVIFTLDGKQHARPVVGEVNVIVRKNGTTSKVMVK